MNVLIKKTIIVLITIIMVSNFIMPNEVQAVSWSDVGKNLINGLFDLLRFIADLFLQVMQKMMVGVWKIEEYNGNSAIQYSPGIIFLNRVAGLKINFIGATEDDNEITNNNLVLLENNTEVIEMLDKVYLATLDSETGCVREELGKWTVKANKFFVVNSSDAFNVNEETGLNVIYDEIQIVSSPNGINLAEHGITEIIPMIYGTNNDATNADVTRARPGLAIFTTQKESNLYTLSVTRDRLAANTGYDNWKNCYFYNSKNKSTENPDLMMYASEEGNFAEDNTMEMANGKHAFDYFVYVGSTYTGKDGNEYNPLSAQLWVHNGYLYVAYSYSWGEGMYQNNSYMKLTRYNISNISELNETKTMEATSNALQRTISTWYQALRTVALVGLLSVLVYIGIRIILSSSSAQDKAKYKNMLKDWLVAICILFMLHYIMAFMLGVTENLNEIIQNNVAGTTLDGNTSDKLMSKVRDRANEASEFNEKISESFGYTVMYLALVILTFVFTFQYLKRVVFMAFLTMIAPMIALTYPLDKIKDGKAQAFSFWLREYIFNCLIQPVHLLLYTVLISSAFSFATENILYAIAALAFMVPAEKFIKEMFGMKTQSPTGQLGAAAGGAMVMSMLNKIKAKPPKDGAEGAGSGSSSGGSNGVRTATRNGGGAGATSSGSSGGSAGGAGTFGTGTNTGRTGSNAGRPGTTGAGTSTGNSGATGGGASSGSSSTGGLGRRINAAAKKNIYGWDAIKSNGKKFTKGFGRGVGGAALGLAAGTAALATQVATGEILEDPLKAGAAVAGVTAVGYHAGSNLVGSGLNNVKNLTEGAKKLAYGEEAYSNRQFDKKFFSSEGYKTITEDSSIDQTNIKARTQEFLDNGITDVNDIRKALQSGVSGDEYKAMTNMGMDKKDIATFAKVKGSSAARGLGASEIAARMQIAKNLPSQLYNDQTGFVRFAKRYGIDEAEAKKLFKDIDKFI